MNNSEIFSKNIPIRTSSYSLTQASPARNYLILDFTMKGWYFCCYIRCQVYLATVFPLNFTRLLHCVESVHIRSFSGLHFPAFELNMEIHGLNLRIQSECGKIRTRKTPNTDTFHAVS